MWWQVALPLSKFKTVYALAAPMEPAPLTTWRSRNRTAAIPMTTITVKKSENVCSADTPVSSTDVASVSLTV